MTQNSEHNPFSYTEDEDSLSQQRLFNLLHVVARHCRVIPDKQTANTFALNLIEKVIQVFLIQSGRGECQNHLTGRDSIVDSAVNQPGRR